MMNEVVSEVDIVAFFDHQPQPAFWMTPVFGEGGIVDFEYRYCNLEFYNYTRQRPEALIGVKLSNTPLILKTEHRKRLFSELLEVYEQGNRTQAWLLNPDLGKYYSYTRNKVAGGILTVLQDRTEEYEMMQQLEKQKGLLENILRYSSNGITVGEMVRDVEGKIIDIMTIIANDAAVQYTGIPHEVYTSRTGAEIDPYFVESEYFQLCVACMETGRPFLTQYYLQSAGKWLEVSVSKMDEERQIYIFTDITTVKQAQIELQQLAEKLQLVVNTTQAGFLLADPVFDTNNELVDFRFTMVNGVLASFTERSSEELVGELGSRWFARYKTNGLFEKFKDAYLNQRRIQFDFHYRASEGDIWVNIMTVRVKDELLCSVTDFTSTKLLQIQLEKTVEELMRSNESLGEFAYAASHDLQEPLRKIQVFSEQLRRNLSQMSAEESSSILRRLESAAIRMRTLIEDLLAYSQVSAKNNAFESIELNTVIANVLQDLYASVLESQAVIEIDRLPMIQGDRRQLHQLFQNLVGNALKYRRSEVTPRIAIEAHELKEEDLAKYPELEHIPKGAYHYICVRDNGIGFEPEHSRKIFQVFQRLHGRSEYPGTGVGLAIVQRIVTNHNGYVFAMGEPGVGAKFCILLPK